ncbi:type II toxin-antitoxin system VapB family antitoxin [Sulfuriroseicoccus oceanibius]|uniref:Type II toxin-antitoxin system VapB family antitoxin n=1 Tax=Sulfuriroseicoccus oceanibius TaxID=2707525 RepID=A0A6B3LBQ2_9BACT|nr:type II toxin-antitoxin system VapB family antitoxin [Sulfuriroseicoccus oceanibius]QQL45071.1 type II toxin-antitoxin system VapB family antitoxin [Sulfuriroseicoccus oceanibius]
MRITIEIDETTLEHCQAITGESKKSPAVAKAVEEFVKRKLAAEFGSKIMESHFDYPETSEELSALDR